MNSLLVNEIYKSISGETSFAGLPFIILRLSGCNLRCSYCDSKFSYNEGKKLSFTTLFKKIKTLKTKNILITGGEPLEQKESLNLFTSLLIAKNYTVMIETNGTHSLKNLPEKTHYIIDIKTPSSKMHSFFNNEIINEITFKDEIKFVIANISDYDFSKKLIKKLKLDKKTNILFSCVYKKISPKTIVEKMLEDNLNVRFQLQMHKYIWPPNKRRV